MSRTRSGTGKKPRGLNPGGCHFRPIETPDAGFELHWADAATNKILAMASRAEIRDGFDAMHWHRNPISLGAIVWAAAGKDVGLTPGFILEEIRRNARITPSDLSKLQTVTPIDAQNFGVAFRQAAREAEELILALPPDSVGHLFTDQDGNVIEPDPRNPATLSHPLAPSQGGLIPEIRDAPEQ